MFSCELSFVSCTCDVIDELSQFIIVQSVNEVQIESVRSNEIRPSHHRDTVASVGFLISWDIQRIHSVVPNHLTPSELVAANIALSR